MTKTSHLKLGDRLRVTGSICVPNGEIAPCARQLLDDFPSGALRKNIS